MDTFYPRVYIKKKSTDDPWINDNIRKRIRQRRSVFKREGRLRKWKKLKKICERMIKRRREAYFEKHKIVLSSPDAARKFFQNVNAYKSSEKPKIWNINDFRPSLSDEQLAGELSCCLLYTSPSPRD